MTDSLSLTDRFSDRSPGFGRNTIEGPGFASFDIRFSRDIHIHQERVKLGLMFEAFNALNRANFSAIQQTPFNYTAATRVFNARGQLPGANEHVGSAHPATRGALHVLTSMKPV